MNHAKPAPNFHMLSSNSRFSLSTNLSVDLSFFAVMQNNIQGAYQSLFL